MRLGGAIAVLTSGLLALGKNITVDDTSVQWAYTPGLWGATSANAPCPSCQSQPDADRTFKGTWHDTTSAGSATLSFTGVGASVYVICPGPHAGGQYALDLSFRVDGKDAGTFVDTPCRDYIYDYKVYDAAGLPFGAHTVQIVNHVDTTTLTPSNLLLDYAVVYGVSDDTSNGGSSSPSRGTSSSSVHPATIVVPILVLLAVVGLSFWLYLRFQRHKRRGTRIREVMEPDAFDPKEESGIPASPFTLPTYNVIHGRSSSPPPPGLYAWRPSVSQSHDGTDTELEAAISVVLSRARPVTPHSLPATSPSSMYFGDWKRTGSGMEIQRRGTQTSSSMLDSEDGDFRAPPSYADTLSRK